MTETTEDLAAMGDAEDDDLRLISQKETERVTDLSNTEIWRLRSLPKGDPDRFPEPVEVGVEGTRIKFVWPEVAAWIRSRQRRRLGHGKGKKRTGPMHGGGRGPAKSKRKRGIEPALGR